MVHLGKLLLLAGAAVMVAGVLLIAGERLGLGHLGLGRLGLGRLPGDLRFERGGVRVTFPITSALLVSLVLTLILNLITAFFRR
jgi:hypothetical protein